MDCNINNLTEVILTIRNQFLRVL